MTRERCEDCGRPLFCGHCKPIPDTAKDAELARLREWLEEARKMIQHLNSEALRDFVCRAHKGADLPLGAMAQSNSASVPPPAEEKKT